MTKRKILILGSEGFIGNALLRKLYEDNYDITGADLLDISPTNYTYYKVGRLSPEFDIIFQGQQFDYCINAAGSGSVPLSVSDPKRDFDANVIDTFKILDAIRIFNPTCKYLHFSSAAVYGNPVVLPVKEDAQPQPLSPYGFHKFQSELICSEYVKLHLIKVAILRPFSAYGPGLRKQLVWDLFQKIKDNGVISLFGTGEESRDFIYIDDIAEAVLTILKSGQFDGEIYNIASGEETRVKDIIEEFRNLNMLKQNIIFDNVHRKEIPLRWQADISKIKGLGFVPKHSIKSGIEKTLTWLQTNG